MVNKRLIYKDYNLLEAQPTSHNIGVKKVLLSNSETLSNITQLAISKLFAKECVENHVHPTMDEHFIITSGSGIMYVDNVKYDLCAGKFILVPAGCIHNLNAITDFEFITIAVAI